MLVSAKCDTAAQLEGEQLAYLLRVVMVDVRSVMPEILQYTEK